MKKKMGGGQANAIWFKQFKYYVILKSYANERY